MEPLFLKTSIFTVVGMVGAIIAQIFGGWDSAMITLLIFMGIDYITGIIVAGVFRKSAKTNDGALSSNIGWKGLCKKGFTLLVVLMAQRLDIMMGSHFIRDAVIIAYTLNESLSIIENAGLMGLPIPEVIRKAISALQTQKTEGKTQ